MKRNCPHAFLRGFRETEIVPTAFFTCFRNFTCETLSSLGSLHRLPIVLVVQAIVIRRPADFIVDSSGVPGAPQPTIKRSASAATTTATTATATTTSTAATTTILIQHAAVPAAGR